MSSTLWFYVGLASVLFAYFIMKKFSSCSLLCEKHYIMHYFPVFHSSSKLQEKSRICWMFSESLVFVFSQIITLTIPLKGIGNEVVMKWDCEDRELYNNITTTSYSVITYPLVSVLQGLTVWKATLLFLIHICHRCIIKILITYIVTHRSSSVLFNGYKNIQKKQS